MKLSSLSHCQWKTSWKIFNLPLAVRNPWNEGNTGRKNVFGALEIDDLIEIFVDSTKQRELLSARIYVQCTSSIEKQFCSRRRSIYSASIYIISNWMDSREQIDFYFDVHLIEDLIRLKCASMATRTIIWSDWWKKNRFLQCMCTLFSSAMEFDSILILQSHRRPEGGGKKVSIENSVKSIIYPGAHPVL